MIAKSLTHTLPPSHQHPRTHALTHERNAHESTSFISKGRDKIARLTLVLVDIMLVLLEETLNAKR